MAKNKEEEFDFELDEDDKIDEYTSEVNLILTTLGKIDQDLTYSVLTNSSKFVDFDLTGVVLGISFRSFLICVNIFSKKL